MYLNSKLKKVNTYHQNAVVCPTSFVTSLKNKSKNVQKKLRNYTFGRWCYVPNILGLDSKIHKKVELGKKKCFALGL